MTKIILIFSLVCSFSLMAKEKTLDKIVVQEMISSKCDTKMTVKEVSSDTYYVYNCKDLDFYVFKRVRLASDTQDNYRMFIADSKTREPLTKIKDSEENEIALIVINQYKGVKANKVAKASLAKKKDIIPDKKKSKKENPKTKEKTKVKTKNKQSTKK